MSDEASKSPGITFLSVTVSFLSILLLAILIQFFEVIEGSFASASVSFARHALAVPAILIFLVLLIAGGLYQQATRTRLISRAEALCILFSLLIAAPIISTGFWGKFIGTLGTIPRSGEFEKMAGLSDKLWPHGENLLEGALDDPGNPNLRVDGDVRWERTEYEEGAFPFVPVLRNSDPDATSTLRVRVPVTDHGMPNVLLGEAYVISVLARATDLGAESAYYARIYRDDADTFTEEAFSTSVGSARSITRPMGFQRFGAYGLTFSNTVREALWIEFGLQGQGKLELLFPRLRCVRAFENAYEGRSTVTETEWGTLDPNEQQRAVMKPDNMLSWAGLEYLVTGYIHWGDWAESMLAWFVFMALVVTGTFAVAVIMRRQWIQNERFPLPVAQIPIALLGGDLDGHADTGGSLWHNRTMWLGFWCGLFWCLMQGWAAYDRNVPNMTVDVPLKPYLASPDWGHMWTDVSFTVSAIFLSLAIFMELNVLMSLVVGYFLYRAQMWFGHQQGLAVSVQDYPFTGHQEVGAYLTYALLILFFTRRYLARILKLAVFGFKALGATALDAGRDAFTPEEVRGYRVALLAIAACFAVMGLWSKWVGLPVLPMLVFFLVVLLVGLVAARIRAECGAPFAYYFPFRLMLVIAILGGLGFFEAEGYIFALLASLVMFEIVFFIIPGLQVELLDIGARLRVSRRHLAVACMIGVVGGFVIGGWVHLSSLYALGRDEIQSRTPLADRRWDMLPYNHAVQKANSEFLAEATGTEEEEKTDPAFWAYVYAGGLTGVVAILRQAFAGFWFHPVGIILSPSTMLNLVWGSCLTAAAIRFVVLRLGGAVTVRQKLLPFFVGVFISAVAAYGVFALITTYIYFFKSGSVRFPLIL